MQNSKRKTTLNIETLLETRPQTDPGNGKRNWIGLRTLYFRETKRFLKVYVQTVIVPTITTLIFLAIFTLAIGQLRGDTSGIPFIQFLAPGLIMMAILQCYIIDYVDIILLVRKLTAFNLSLMSTELHTKLQLQRPSSLHILLLDNR